MLSLRSKIVAGFVVGKIILCVIGVVSYICLHELEASAEWRAHTYAVIGKLQLIRSIVAESGSAARDFALTGNEALLEPSIQARALVPGEVQALKQLVSDNPGQTARFATLSDEVTEQLSLDAQMVKNKRAGLGGPESSALFGRSAQSLQQIKTHIAELNGTEEELLGLRSERLRSIGQITGATIIIGSVAAIVIAILANIVIGREINMRQRLSDESNRRQQWFSTTLSSIGDAVIATDDNGCVTFMNPVAQKLTGWSEADAAGKSLDLVFNIVNESSRAPVESPVRKALREGRVVGMSNHTMLIPKVGGEIAIDDSAAPIRDAQGMIYGVVMVFRDVTDKSRHEDEQRKNAERTRVLNAELTKRVGELDVLNKELETFSYSVSHDLRAPLRAIDGFSQSLLEDYFDKLDATGQLYLQRVRNGSQRMARLIDDMLSLSRITRTEFKNEEIDLSALATNISEELRRSDPARKVEFIIPEGMKGSCDGQLIRQVLENLLGNAWKFTAKKPKARIELGASVSAEGGRVFYVRDDGAGFEPAYKEKLFGAFQRLHRESEFPGTGIGLASVQRIIHRHGGRVWADGEPEKGATIYFTLNGGHPV